MSHPDPSPPAIATVPGGPVATPSPRARPTPDGPGPMSRWAQPEPVDGRTWATWSSPRTSLVSRERDLAQLRELLVDPAVAMVTLTGPGGVGKTRLALQLATELRRDGAFDAVAWVPLASVDSSVLVLPAIARSIGLTAERADIAAGIIGGLSGRRVLLVLDNCEQILDAGSDLAGLLDALPMVTILATSRSAFRISGEWEVVVRPLAMPVAGTVVSREMAEQVPAIQLFTQRAQAVDARFELTDANSAVVAAICERLDGLPLAIRHFPPTMLLSRLDRSLSVLTGGARDLPVRQQTLRAAIAWSYDLLTPEERLLFARLSVAERGASLSLIASLATVEPGLPGPDSLAIPVVKGRGLTEIDQANAERFLAVPDVGPEVVDVLALLVDKSLVVVREDEGGRSRYAMLQTVREFARERLADDPAGRAAIQAAHAAWCLRLALHARRMVRTQRDWFQIVDAEDANLTAALRWLLEHEPGRALELVTSLWRSWVYRAQLRDALGFLRVAMDRVAGAAGGWQELVTSEIWAEAHYMDGAIAFRLGDYPAVERPLRRSIELYEPTADPYAVRSAVMELSGYLMTQKRNDEIPALFALLPDDLAAETEGFRLDMRAIHHFFLGDHAQAAGQLDQAYEAFRREGDLDRAINTRRNVAVIQQERGRLRDAAAALSDALELGAGNQSAGYLIDLMSMAGYLAKERFPWEQVLLTEMAVRLARERNMTPTPLDDPETRAAYEAAVRSLAPDERERATAEATGLDLSGAVARTESILRRLASDLPVQIETTSVTAPQPAVSPASAAGLTTREVEILRLVAKGQSNPEIGAMLFISPRTVGTHVAHILAKLDVGSRTEAATWAVQHGIPDGQA